MSEDSETTTVSEQAENNAVGISELREQEELGEHEYANATASYVNEAGSPYSIVRVKESLPELDAKEQEWVDTRYRTVAVEVKGEIAHTKKAVSEIVRSNDGMDIRFEPVGTVEEQPRPGVEKEEFDTYKLVVLWDEVNGRHDTQEE